MGQAACAAPEAQAGPQDVPAEGDGAALCPNVGAVHHRADRHAGGGGVGRADVSRRDLWGLASSWSRPSGGGGPTDRGDGRTPDRRGLLGLYGAEQRNLKAGSDEHLRAVLECFDLKRLTTQTNTTLLAIIGERYP